MARTKKPTNVVQNLFELLSLIKYLEQSTNTYIVIYTAIGCMSKTVFFFYNTFVIKMTSPTFQKEVTVFLRIQDDPECKTIPTFSFQKFTSWLKTNKRGK